MPAVGVPVEALDVAVALVDRLGLAAAAAKVADAQELAVQGVVVLREVGVAGLAGGHVEQAVRPEVDPPAVVDGGGFQAVEDHGVLGQGDRPRSGSGPPRCRSPWCGTGRRSGCAGTAGPRPGPAGRSRPRRPRSPPAAGAPGACSRRSSRRTRPPRSVSRARRSGRKAISQGACRPVTTVSSRGSPSVRSGSRAPPVSSCPPAWLAAATVVCRRSHRRRRSRRGPRWRPGERRGTPEHAPDSSQAGSAAKELRGAVHQLRAVQPGPVPGVLGDLEAGLPAERARRTRRRTPRRCRGRCRTRSRARGSRSVPRPAPAAASTSGGDAR